MAIFHDLIVVGAPNTTNGTAYVYDRRVGVTNDWGQLAVLTASDGASGDRFGQSVAIDGYHIAAGAPYYSGGRQARGAGYLFSRNRTPPTVWGQAARLVAPAPQDDDRFGDSVALSDDTLAIGSPYIVSNRMESIIIPSPRLTPRTNPLFI